MKINFFFLSKYSLEGHQFAVFGFALTNDLRYMVSISTRFITWDLSTSDLTRDVNPCIEGIMQQLVLSPDNKWASAYTNNNQVISITSIYFLSQITNKSLHHGELCETVLVHRSIRLMNLPYEETGWRFLHVPTIEA